MEIRSNFSSAKHETTYSLSVSTSVDRREPGQDQGLIICFSAPCYFTPNSILEDFSWFYPMHFYITVWMWAGLGFLVSPLSSSVGIAIKTNDKKQTNDLPPLENKPVRCIEVCEVATGQIWAPRTWRNHEEICCGLEIYQSSNFLTRQENGPLLIFLSLELKQCVLF